MDKSDSRRKTRKRKLEPSKPSKIREKTLVLKPARSRNLNEKNLLEEEKLSKELFGYNFDFINNLNNEGLFSSSTNVDIDVKPDTDQSNDSENEQILSDNDQSNDSENEQSFSSSSEVNNDAEEILEESESENLVRKDVVETEHNVNVRKDIKHKPVWEDKDDDNIKLESALNIQGRNIKGGGIIKKSGKYSNFLKHKFESFHKTPKWAKLSKEQKESDSDDEILQSCGHLSKAKSTSLTPNTLEFKKLHDLNVQTYNEGPLITSVQFHPTSTVAIVAGISGIASIYAVDGVNNNKLHSVSFDNFPILCTKYLQNGSEVLLGSKHAHVFSYDLMLAKAIRIFLPHKMTQCKLFEVSPCQQYIAVAGRWGEVHWLSASTKELIATFKQNYDVTDLAFNANGSLLFGHSVEGEVTVWDVGSRRIKHKWNDEGCITGTNLRVSPSGKLIATGSAQGVINLYDIETVLNNKNPIPRKSILNLTTSITEMQFNSTSEILGFSSSERYNSLRLLHVSSGIVFNNFPKWGTKFGRINTMSFSPNSGYAAFGDRKSRVLLYRLKHFKNY